MTRVGFTIVDGKVNWMGGINYLKNLLYALSQLEDTEIEPVLFLGKKTDVKLADQFAQLAKIEYDSLFDRYSVKWIIYTISRDLLRRNFLINRIIKKHNIHVFSHSYIYGPDVKCKTVNWIPDFQHIRLPHLYSKLHLAVRGYRLKAAAKYSDKIILSSYDALNDFNKFAQKYAGKATVIHFVSQVSAYGERNIEYLWAKYNFATKYFFLPNQFWAHKNHKIAFEAINIAKLSCDDILLICSGEFSDNRKSSHIYELGQFINKNNLENNIKMVGLIPFSDVLLFMKNCISIINPSHFEGWSSTVEEAKGMNKGLILSNIPVHIEQAPLNGIFFNPDNAEELAGILVREWSNPKEVEEIAADSISNNIKQKTLEFAKCYNAVIKSVLIA